MLISVPLTIEDFENGLYDFDVEVDVEFIEGEKPTLYERDGSGYPGSPSQVIVNNVTVTEITNCGGYVYTKETSPIICNHFSRKLVPFIANSESYLSQIEDWISETE